jgi:hypothetical protein
VSADGFRDLLTVEGAYRDAVSGACCRDACWFTEDAK